jgi:hypothetical protein
MAASTLHLPDFGNYPVLPFCVFFPLLSTDCLLLSPSSNVPHVEVDHTVASTKLLGPYLDAHTLNYTNHQSLLVSVIRDTSCIHNTAKARLSQKGLRRWDSGRPRESTANPFQRKVVIGATVWSISAWGMLNKNYA